jgi:hypothetical protein
VVGTLLRSAANILVNHVTENPMDSTEILGRLRLEAGFRFLPLLGSTGQVVGAHLTRFVPGGHIDVLQVWDGWAAFARLPNELNLSKPLARPSLADVKSGSLSDVARPLLPLSSFGSRQAR